MDRRLLFPAVAITAWAQQPSPPAAEAESALRAQVEKFYQLQVDKKFRQAEALVAEDSKDDYYNAPKSDIKNFSIQEIELLDNNTRAKVTLKGKFTVRAPFGAQDFVMPAISFWKLENGQWVWYIDRVSGTQSPFGRINPATSAAKGPAERPTAIIDAATLMNQVTLDSTSVALDALHPTKTITISNKLAGPIRLELKTPELEGISVELEKSNLKGGETGSIRFRLTGKAGSSGVARLVATPLNKVFEIQVSSN